MRAELPSETATINRVWKMTRHTVCVGCDRYKQTNADATCRACIRKVLEVLSYERANGPIEDDLSYYDVQEEVPLNGNP